MATVSPNQGASTRFIVRELRQRLFLGAATNIDCRRGPVSPVQDYPFRFRTRVPESGRAFCSLRM